ncbi:MAG TPA: M4 family metallopeptidase [Nocardioidaceae bacterium]|nr:M4 family metallopeptidase [Nocardioidaceae bacterium]
MRRTAGLASLAAFAAGIAIAVPSAGAAGGRSPDTQSAGLTRAVSTAGDVARGAVRALRAHPVTGRVGADQRFTVVAALVDPDGSTHVRLTRTYKGLRVLGGDLVVHRAASDAWRGTSLTLRRAPELSTRATVSAKAAAALVGANSVRRTPELVVDATGAQRLAWEVVSHGRQADGTPSRLASYVDAQSGTVLRTEQQIHTVDGQGQSLYSGTVPLQLTLAGGTYSLKDPTRGNTYTNDVKNKTDSVLCTLFGFSCQVGTTFTSPDNLFGNGLNSNRESAGVDAQYGTNKTWDYFKLEHGRNGIFGTGAGSWNRVHYGANYVNAFWDGKKMTYGDGNGTTYGPLVSLDVAGHEMAHGVTQNSSNLTYSGESGGLNESTSDIFGSLVEAYAANPNDPADYYIGEEFDLVNHKGLRRMDDPDSDGKSVNCWSSTVGNLDVHYSSGVGNHFFYLLAEGSTPKTMGGLPHNSPTCNGSSNLAGIGTADAGRIWYRALTVYMTSSTNYAGARTASLNAARDLFGGVGNARYNAVAAAWSAVGVG